MAQIMAHVRGVNVQEMAGARATLAALSSRQAIVLGIDLIARIIDGKFIDEGGLTGS